MPTGGAGSGSSTGRGGSGGGALGSGPWPSGSISICFMPGWRVSVLENKAPNAAHCSALVRPSSLICGPPTMAVPSAACRTPPRRWRDGCDKSTGRSTTHEELEGKPGSGNAPLRRTLQAGGESDGASTAIGPLVADSNHPESRQDRWWRGISFAHRGLACVEAAVGSWKKLRHVERMVGFMR
jgi:hypothetical protein